MPLQIKMDDEEIDSWYEEEKQKCLDEYLREIETSKNHEEAEKRYNDKLGRLIGKYNQMMEKRLEGKKTGKFGKIISSMEQMGTFFRKK